VNKNLNFHLNEWKDLMAATIDTLGLRLSLDNSVLFFTFHSGIIQLFKSQFYYSFEILIE